MYWKAACLVMLSFVHPSHFSLFRRAEWSSVNILCCGRVWGRLVMNLLRLILRARVCVCVQFYMAYVLTHNLNCCVLFFPFRNPDAGFSLYLSCVFWRQQRRLPFIVSLVFPFRLAIERVKKANECINIISWYLVQRAQAATKPEWKGSCGCVRVSAKSRNWYV